MPATTESRFRLLKISSSSQISSRKWAHLQLIKNSIYFFRYNPSSLLYLLENNSRKAWRKNLTIPLKYYSNKWIEKLMITTTSEIMCIKEMNIKVYLLSVLQQPKLSLINLLFMRLKSRCTPKRVFLLAKEVAKLLKLESKKSHQDWEKC